MPKEKPPTHTSDTPKPPSRRKARPKFEVAPEQVAAPAAGWVYRDDQSNAKPHAEPEAERPAAVVSIASAKTHKPELKPEIKPAASPGNHPVASIPMFAFGLMAVGIGTFVHVALFAVRTLNSPVRLASGILGRLRRA